MSMSSTQRDALLSDWIKPSSNDEKTQQDRAERMVRTAIERCNVIDMRDVSIYTKGSYPNNTNVRRDSDVDVVVEQNGCQYYGYWDGQPRPENHTSPYQGPWTPRTWRAAVNDALVDYFGAASVDATGRVAINISAVAGSRPSADVVPSFDYVRYDDPSDRTSHEGSCVFPTDGGDKIVNWPQQQLDNGRAFNRITGSRYKNFVRALKNAENTLAAGGIIDNLPSYFMECLVWNVPTSILTSGFTLSGGFKATLQWLYHGLDDGSAQSDWEEPNKLKWLFKGHQKWSVADGKSLIAETWNYLGYGS
jgi:hypothetical protein